MIRCLLFVTLFIHACFAQKPVEPQPQPQPQPLPEPSAKKWPTLSGKPPLVIARGGFSGLFPESSAFANEMADQLKLTDVALFCNLQLTKDGVGFCLTDIRLDNSTNVAMLYPKDSKTYNVNGQQVKGWFSVDFNSDVIMNNLSLVQSVMSRTNAFDGQMTISIVDDVTNGLKSALFWLNVQYDAFYTEHKHSVSTYLEKAMRFFPTSNFISSPEVGFLKSMNGKVNKARTKLIFQFLDQDVVEPTTKQTYGAILKDLAAIKTYASGILVPKGYIWPVGPNKYLGNPTTLVADAHKLGLEVYASGFANDMPASYNYSYDPAAEYLQFVGNPQFSVDGLLTDFSPTASATIACFAASEPSKPQKGKALIITHNGASGMNPGCTDLAYEQAVTDGADVIDCSVQMSQDGVAFCLDSADLTGDTTAMPTFMTRSSSVPEVQKDKGIFSFDLTWTEIQSLKPQMLSPFGQNAGFQRNPAAQNKGKFMTLTDFLEFAKTKAVSGILINIENAAYLASKKGLDIVDSVTKALTNATFDKQQTQQVFIQSDDSSVLSQFQGVPAYKRLLRIKEEVGDAPKQTVDEVKKYADGVVVARPSLISIDNGFAKAETKVLEQMRAANISVYVFVLRNEYVTLPFDYYADPTVELATYVAGLEVDGVITEYPGTASRYMRSPCVDLNGDMAIMPAQAGSLLKQVPLVALPPANAPNPPLDVDDIVDPPLPPVSKSPSNGSSTASPNATAPSSSSGRTVTANFGLCLAAVMAVTLLSLPTVFQQINIS